MKLDVNSINEILSNLSYCPKCLKVFYTRNYEWAACPNCRAWREKNMENVSEDDIELEPITDLKLKAKKEKY